MTLPHAALLSLLGATLLHAGETPAPSPPARPRASDRLGIVYTPPPAATPKPDEPIASAPGPILVLPQLDVRADRVDLEEHRILTDKGRLDVAKRRHLSPLYRKTLGPLSLVATLAADPLLLLGGSRANDAEALALHAEEERVRRRTETAELIDLIDDVDPALSKKLRQSTTTSFRSPTSIGERRRE